MADLQNEMERIGRILAGDQCLSVKIQGCVAYAQPGEVVLPNIATWEVLGRDARKMLNGLCDHETGHSAYSDFKLIHAVNMHTKGKKGSAYLTAVGLSAEDQDKVYRYKSVVAHLLNAIEDGWMERAQGRRYPGARVNMDRKNQWFWTVVRDGKGAKATMDAGKFPAVMLAVTLITRKSRVLADFEPWPNVHAALEAIATEIAEVDACRSSVTALHIALRMLDVLSAGGSEADDEGDGDAGGEKGEDEDKSESKPDDKGEDESKPDDKGDDESAPGDGSDESEDEDTDGDGEDEGEGEDEGADKSEGGGIGKADDGDEGKADADSEGEDESEAKSKGRSKRKRKLEVDVLDWDPDDKSDPVRTPETEIGELITHAMLDAAPGKADYVNLNPDDGLVYDLSDARDAVDVAIEATCAATVAPLVSAFEAGLRARKERRLVPGSDEGIVDTEMLAAYSAGGASSDEIFMSLTPDESRDTAVSILVDCSASMGHGDHAGSKSHTARLATQAMVMALETLAVPVEVTGFTSLDSADAGYMRKWRALGNPATAPNTDLAFAELREGLAKQESLGVSATRFAREIYRDSRSSSHANLLLPMYAVFKHFDSALGGLGGMTGVHENLDGEAVLWAARRLVERHEPRKVMFVLSDGVPAGSRSSEQGARYLRECVEQMIENGIEVYAIGIKTESVKNYYPRHVVVNDLKDLATTALDALTEMLVECRQGD